MTSEADLSAAFKLAMRRLATTVSILTCRGPGGPLGMTVTAVTSLCADPPAVLVCVNRAVSLYPSLRIGTRVCLSLLAEHQVEVCETFGGRRGPVERFAAGEWEMDTDPDAPFLADAQSNLFCVVDAMFDYGTHSVVVCKLQSVRMHGEVRPLIFGDGGFMRPRERI